MRRKRASRPWHLYGLAVVAVAVAVLAIVEIGPPTSSARTAKEIVTAENGVVQSTVTGSGNVQAGTDVDVNFKASGTLQHVYVSVGQHVTKDQLLATLDPTTAQLSFDQAEDQLIAAQDQLTEIENGTATGTSGGSSGGSTGSTGSTGSGATDASLSSVADGPEFVSYTPAGRHRPSRGTTTTTPTTTTPTTTTTTTTPARTRKPTTGSSTAGGGGSSTKTTQTTTTPSPSSIASAEASVFSAEADVRSARNALNDTKLYAPTSGTIASLAGLLPGDSVSAGSSSNAAGTSSSSNSSSSGSGGGLAGGTATAGSLGGSSSSSSSSGGSSNSPFAEIVNTGTMTMTVAFSESDISKVKVGQPATVTFDALPGVELGAHVTQISPVGTTSSGVVSYNATLTLDQRDSAVKPGMSASAAVIVSQAQGVTVPNQAVTGTGSLGTVNVLEDGKTVSQQVVVGLRGDSRTQIISGLRAGQQLVVTITLPSLSSGASSTGSSGTLGGAGRFGGLGGGGLGGGGLGGGGAFFRRAAGGG